ncbi:peptidase s1 and s6 chymotrypsin hap : Tetratricopeptide TPR_2 repeat protein OS=Pirellula staleyi (strain ATCC 27377 / DSM 6068 / ICPB 4128) GN=Psta_2170 PE=4 SV=1: TPR_11: TPR_9 [Gemmata massiliana]|uniref:Tetratricopeptide repeat protein n=1 Tax=Gemmata massiliana TaxID=1210884 RepID=A0A6P2CSX8_9BACT|nr:tetratricopeptide repeat protein [Gemmata massiliana]VTR91717.1 peptidase s1 and s6 chymotrypsin hap : Tetratricopeptide TPR_2 repeat protein OS=Pirellula staleyi (strain ATCC 27377 / DSM 6068 / ICPB 4128) GN=Psta_2170 PE=4 SV=1: TPR_11: TPR_9 [Gemmata massiliana]
MDGRFCLKCFALGFALAGAIGCNRNNVQPSPFGQMPNTNGAPNPLTPTGGKSMWGGSGSNAPPPSVPVEFTPAASNKPASADALVAISDVRLDAAFDEKTVPGSKESLLDLAREGYQKALKQEPKNKSALLGIARFYGRIGEKEKAIEAYKKYLTLYPNDASAAHEVAVTHARWKDWAGACSWCEFTLKIDPENRNVKKTLGFCLARAGKWDEAFAMLCQIMPEAQARHNLAGLLDHMGHADASKSQLQLAVKADPNYAPARDFLAELDQPRVGTADPSVRQTGDLQPAP